MTNPTTLDLKPKVTSMHEIRAYLFTYVSDIFSDKLGNSLERLAVDTKTSRSSIFYWRAHGRFSRRMLLRMLNHLDIEERDWTHALSITATALHKSHWRILPKKKDYDSSVVCTLAYPSFKRTLENSAKNLSELGKPRK